MLAMTSMSSKFVHWLRLVGEWPIVEVNNMLNRMSLEGTETMLFEHSSLQAVP